MAKVTLPSHIIKGRGAATRLPHRFERDVREAYDDGWGTLEDSADSSPRPVTEVLFEDARSAISRNDSPDIFFDYSVNPYRDCEHGCIYCYARPTHSYLNLSPGLDFETKIIAKQNIAQILRSDLGQPGYVARLLNIGSATDCYQPVERELRLTRQVIEVLQQVRHPFSVITKSAGIERDLDLLVPLAEARLAAAYITITTLDGHLARIMVGIQEMRGGKDYDSDFASRMKGDGLWANLIRQRFEKTCRRLGFNR